MPSSCLSSSRSLAMLGMTAKRENYFIYFSITYSHEKVPSSFWPDHIGKL